MSNFKRFKRFLSLLMILAMVLSYGSEISFIAGSGEAYGASETEAVSTDEKGNEGSGRISIDDIGEYEDEIDDSQDIGEYEDEPEEQETPAVEDGGDVDAPEEADETEIIDEDLEEPEGVEIVERTVRVKAKESSIYKKNGKASDELKTANKFWKALTGHKPGVRDDVSKKAASVEVTVKGRMPKDATVEAKYIQFDEDRIYSERAVMELRIMILDGDGNLYIPKSKVTVTVSGKRISSAVENSESVLIYAYEENPGREDKLDVKYAADSLVYRTDRSKNARRNYEVYNKDRNSKDAVRFVEAKNGLKTGDKKLKFDFRYGYGLSRLTEDVKEYTDYGRFIVSAQAGERTLNAEDGDTSAKITGYFDKRTSASLKISDFDPAALSEKCGGEKVVSASISVEDKSYGRYQPDNEVEVTIKDPAIKEAGKDISEFKDDEANEGKTARRELWSVDSKGNVERIKDADFDGDTVTFHADRLRTYAVVKYIEGVTDIKPEKESGESAEAGEEGKTEETGETAEGGKTDETAETGEIEDGDQTEAGEDGKTDETAETGETADGQDSDVKEDAGTESDEEDKTDKEDKEDKDSVSRSSGTRTVTAYEKGKYKVTAKYDPSEGIPANAELEVSEISAGTEEYGECVSKAAEAINTQPDDLSVARAFDISFVDPDTGEHYQPDSSVSVSIKLIKEDIDSKSFVDVVHIYDKETRGLFGFKRHKEQVDVLDASLDGTTVEFETDGFSTFVVMTYNVDFNWDSEHTYNMDGGESIQLSELLRNLGEDPTDILSRLDNITSSDPESITTEMQEQGSDWIISCIKEFDSDITLTLRMKNEESLTITVSPGDVSVKIGNTAYATLDAALDAAASGDTITLYKDMTGHVSTDKILTLNLGGHTFTADAAECFKSTGGSLTIINGLVVSGYENVICAEAADDNDSAAITLGSNLSIDASGQIIKAGDKGEILIDGAEINCPSSGGTITVSDSSSSIEVLSGSLTNVKFSVDEDASAVVSGGTVNGLIAVSGITTITGGTFDGDVSVSGTGMLKVSGGKFKPAVDESYLESGCVNATQPDSKGYYSVGSPITVSGTLSAASKTYDGSENATLDLRHVRISGISEEDEDDVEVSITGKFVNGSDEPDADVGTDKKVAIEFTISGEAAYKYAIKNELTGEIRADITARPVTVKADDKTMTYGYKDEDEPELTATVTGLADGESANLISYNIDCTKNKNAGEYPITVTGAETQGNYTVTYENGLFTINPKGVTLVANSEKYEYDSENPQEHTISGTAFKCLVDTRENNTIVFDGVSVDSVSGTDPGMYEVKFPDETVGKNDTTGNYIVASTTIGYLTIDDPDQPYVSKYLDRSRTHGDLAYYVIDINPKETILNNTQPLTLKDTFNDDQSINYGSIEIEKYGLGEDVKYDYSGNTGTFTIPDAEHIRISYKTRVKGDAGEPVHVTNTAVLGKMDGYNFAEGPSATVDETITITPTGTDISGTGGNYTIDLYVYAEGHMDQGLGGATFRLLDTNKKPMTYTSGLYKGQEVTFTTSDGKGEGEREGYVTIQSKEGLTIHKNTSYYLEMTVAPYTYDGNEYTYYQKDNTYYSFLITDDPDYTYGGVYSYFNGDVLKVRCYTEGPGVNVLKRFSGNYNLTDEQKNQIVFILEKFNLSTYEWDEVERHTYAEFSYGSINFWNGSKDGPELEDGATYRVIEENALPESLEGIIQENVSVSISYQISGRPINDDSNEFMVDPDDKLSHSYDFVFTNEYVDHKLTMTTLDEDNGNKIPGSEFKVYRTSDTENAVATYITGTDGAANIIRDDQDKGVTYDYNTLYYVIQTDAADDYMLPDSQEKTYFYFSDEEGKPVPDGLPEGKTATDISQTYNAVTVLNHKDKVDVPVIAMWDCANNEEWTDGGDGWPNEIDHVVVGLFKSVNNGPAEPVMDALGLTQRTLELSKTQQFDNTTFKDLDSMDGDDRITYSVRELEIYATEEESEELNLVNNISFDTNISGNGWYVISNKAGVRVDVSKKWYTERLAGQEWTEVDPSGKPAVTFDLYRTTSFADFTNLGDELSRDQLEALLKNDARKVRSGLTLGGDDPWSLTIDSLERADSSNNPYYYFALETVPPRNHEDYYAVTAATGTDLRQLIIKNYQTPVTVNIRAVNLEKIYGEDDPQYQFDITVDDDDANPAVPSAVTPPDADHNYYRFNVTKNGNTYEIKFRVNPEQGHYKHSEAGIYDISLSVDAGDEIQHGYRVKCFNGSLSINKKNISITKGAEKTYGDAQDPSLITVFAINDNGEKTEITDADELEVINSIYLSERTSTEENVGSYDIELTVPDDQGSYELKEITEGKFIIKQADVKVIPKNAEKTYGEEDPEFTAEVKDLKNGDSPSVITYTLNRPNKGEDVGEYQIKASGSADQGNYNVIFVNEGDDAGKLKIKPKTITLQVGEHYKTYGDPDPEMWSVDIDGLEGNDAGGEIKQGNGGYEYVVTQDETETTLLRFNVNYEENDPYVYQNAGVHTLVASGDAIQGNYEVNYSPGTLEIDRADLTVVAEHIVKAPETQDPDLKVSIGTGNNDGWRNGDEDCTENSQAGTGEDEGYTVYTYTRNGETILTFRMKRVEGEDEGVPYDIIVEGDEEQGNYRVSYEWGSLEILSKMTVYVSQITSDKINAAANPSYDYKAVLTLDGSGLNEYKENGFAYDSDEGKYALSFTLPHNDPDEDDPNTKSVVVPAGVTVTVKQISSDPDYATSYNLDNTTNQVAASCTINEIKTDHLIRFKHERICMPVQAMAAQTEDSTNEEGAQGVNPVGFISIPDNEEKTQIIDKAYVETLEQQIGYELPDEKFYQYTHASLYVNNGQTTSSIPGITAIKYDETNNKWLYKVLDGEFQALTTSDVQLKLFYNPTYVCRIDNDQEDKRFYTLRDAMEEIASNDAYARNTETDGCAREATIEMLVDDYPMPSSDNLIIPADYRITLTSASGVNATIRRKQSFNNGSMITNRGELTLDDITVDGNNVASTDAMITNEGSGALIVGKPAVLPLLAKDTILQNANGANGGAIYVTGGTVQINSNGKLLNNNAANGGAIYIAGSHSENSADDTVTVDGDVTIESSDITGNTATYGGAVCIVGGRVTVASTLTGTISDDAAAADSSATNGGAIYAAGGIVDVTGTLQKFKATNGGAVYMTGGTVNVGNDSTAGTISSNYAADGGAFYLEGGTLNVTNGTVGNNTASHSGGMVYAINGKVNMSGGTVSGNTAAEGDGGAVCYSGSETVKIESGVTFSGNEALNGYGGAIYQSSGEITVKGTINKGTINKENKAKNGAAVFVQSGIANFDGCTITDNKATEGGAVGVGSTASRLHFSGIARITNNESDVSTASNKACNVYLNLDSDQIINTAGLENNDNTYVGIYIIDGLTDDQDYDRNDVCGKFGTYSVPDNLNLNKFRNDRNGLQAFANNYKIIWSKEISVKLYRLETYSSTSYPPKNGDNLSTFNYYPRSRENAMYDLVMEMYNNVAAGSFKNKLKADDLYAYSYDSKSTQLSDFITNISWKRNDDGSNGRWVFQKNGSNDLENLPQLNTLKVYYSKGAYVSIVNNSGHTLTIDSLTVNGKDAVSDSYGYITMKNYKTLSSILPLSTENLTLADGESIKLLFPGAVNKAWTLDGILKDEDGNPLPNEDFEYTLDRTYGGTEQSGETDSDGEFEFSGKKTKDLAGGTYEILFGDPTKICKVGNRPFPTLKEAWNYILTNDLTETVTKKDGNGDEILENGVPQTVTVPGGKIEMLLDYLQPKSDVLDNFPSDGKFYLEFTTAEVAPENPDENGLYYDGGEDNSSGTPVKITRATISRDVDNAGAAIVAESFNGKDGTSQLVHNAEDCESFINIHNITFDGKSVAKKGNGGALSTVNNYVTVSNCDFRGYQANRGGAIFAAWGGIAVENCTFSNCETGHKDIDKTGGGGVWTSAKILTVKDCNFNHCSCEIGNSQGGAVFHNILSNGHIFAKHGGGEYADFPANYYLGTKTVIENCNFTNCYSESGSGGTLESDALEIYLSGCNFNGSYSNKSGANGGAINILHNNLYNGSDDYKPVRGSVLQLEDCNFTNCKTQKSGSRGGAIKPSNTETVRIWGCSFNDVYSDYGGAIKMSAKGATLEVLGSTFTNCTGNVSGGAISTFTQTMTIGEYGENKTPSSFINCTSPKYGAIQQERSDTGSSVTVRNTTFTNCTSTNENAGAVYATAKNLIIGDENGDLNSTSFINCSASKAGGAVYHKDGSSDSITNCLFDGCSSGTSGGAAHIISTTTTLADVTTRNCETVNYGGGVYVSSTTSTITDCQFTKNKATAGSSNGGSLYLNAGTTTISGGKFTDSKATYGGGIYNKSTLTITGGAELSECKADKSGGGLYSTVSTTLNGATIKNCYAVESGGGIYSTAKVTTTCANIQDCAAQKGGGIYSTGEILTQNATGDVIITRCKAIDVTLTTDSTGTHAATAKNSDRTDKFSEDNQGGGIYKGGTTTWTLDANNAKISYCKAYDGGGIYYNSTNSTGQMTFNAGRITNNGASNYGGGIYSASAQINIKGNAVIGGSEGEKNTASKGAGLFVANGCTVMIFGSSQITYNESEAGGIAVGGTGSRLLFEGTPTVRYNKRPSDDKKCNVYLDFDTNDIIRTTGTALNANAYIGVYASDEQMGKHGNYTMPFGTYNKTDNLSTFHNDRILSAGTKGDTDNQIVWEKYRCKITDGDNNILYLDDEGTPAVFVTLENNGNASAFGVLNSANPALYKAIPNEDGEIIRYDPYEKNNDNKLVYKVQMYVQDYAVEKQISLSASDTNNIKEITLTTASTTADECGLRYESDPLHPYATITRNATYGSMISITKKAELILENVILDGGYNKEEGTGFISTSDGGIILIETNDAVTVKIEDNATLRNSMVRHTSTYKNGGAIRLRGANSKLYLNGGEIIDCGVDTSLTNAAGGGVSVKYGTFYMQRGIISGCYARSGAGVKVDTYMYMSGGTITENNATVDGGGIAFGTSTDATKVYFSGNPVVTGNTLNESVACNVQIGKDSNGRAQDYRHIIVNDNALGSNANIGVYTEAGTTMRTNCGEEGDRFGTKNTATVDNLYCFVNDNFNELRGAKNGDSGIIWRKSLVLTVRNNVSSDLAYDMHDAVFTYTVNIESVKAIGESMGDQKFVSGGDGVIGGICTINLKAGESKSAVFAYDEFIGANYSVTLNYTSDPDQAACYTPTAKQNENDVAGTINATPITGTLGENMSDDPEEESSTLSTVVYTHDRFRNSIEIGKTVTSDKATDKSRDFTFSIELDGLDNDIETIEYGYTKYQKNDSGVYVPIGESADLTFTDGKSADIRLANDQKITVSGLPTDLRFRVKEKLDEDEFTSDEIKQIRTKIYVDEVYEGASRTSSYSTVLKEKSVFVRFENVFLDFVCKITNASGALLYYKDEGSVSQSEPAVFTRLEDAFEQINTGGLKTGNGGSASGTLNIEMLVPEYSMEESATLITGRSVILTTASRENTDGYPYDKYKTASEQDTAIVYRGFDGGSMINSSGTLGLKNITLNGAAQFDDPEKETYSTNDPGGIINVQGTAAKLAVYSQALLTNSVVNGEDGGAISLGSSAKITTMEGTIENCSARNGGAIYAENGFYSINVSGTITDCKAVVYLDGSNGNGGAVCAGTQSADNKSAGITVSSGAKLSGNSSNSTGSSSPVPSGCGGAIFSAASLMIKCEKNGTEPEISGNTASNDGGGIYMVSGKALSIQLGALIQNNTAENGNGGGIYTQGVTKITSSNLASTNAIRISNNTAVNGGGGAIYATDSAAVTISGLYNEINGNSASAGGAIYCDADVSLVSANVFDNTATARGGAVFVSNGKTFRMSGGRISDKNLADETKGWNKSPEGAISAGGHDSRLIFSGKAVVSGNTNADGSVPMDVYLSYDSNEIIQTPGLNSSAYIGVYVADPMNEQEDDPVYCDLKNYEDGKPYKPLYYKHGIASRKFATYNGTNIKGANLNKFVNNRDYHGVTLSGELGGQNDGSGTVTEYYVIWNPKNMKIVVLYDKDEPDVFNEAAIGVGFELYNITNDYVNGVKVWSGASQTGGIVDIPWGLAEAEAAQTVTFEPGNTYRLVITSTNDSTVMPYGYYEFYVGVDNDIKWYAIKKYEESDEENAVNEIDEKYLGEIEPFELDLFRKPKVIYHADDENGEGVFTNNIKSYSETINFNNTTDYHKDYSINGMIPTRAGDVFLGWAEEPNSREVKYVNGNDYTFYRDKSNCDLVLYAVWETVVCKITDRSDNLLYINGNLATPAVYKTLSEGFRDFNSNEITFKTKTGGAGRPNKLKMVVNDYEMTRQVEVDRGKTMIFTTASRNETDGYKLKLVKGTSTICTIRRGSEFKDTMIKNHFNLSLTNITLDGSSAGGGDTVRKVSVNGGIINNDRENANLYINSGATLQNSAVTGNGTDNGNGGAVYTANKATVTINAGGTINNCEAVNGGAMYVEGIGNMSGGTVTNNKAVNDGGAVYISEKKTDSKSKVTGGEFIMTGGQITGNKCNTQLSDDKSKGNGAGIFIAKAKSASAESGILKLSGLPDFGGTGVNKRSNSFNTNGNFRMQNADMQSATNGGITYRKPRQDVYIEGHSSDDNKPIEAIVLTGSLTNKANDTGYIWVWAAEDDHGKSHKQFAVFETDELRTKIENEGDKVFNATLMAFRNARPDSGNDGSDNKTESFLHGATDIGDDIDHQMKYIYWNDLMGTRKVILRKVGVNSGNYESVKNAKFNIYMNTSDIITGKYAKDTANTTLHGLTSDESGVFYVGELSYGKYYVEEERSGTGTGGDSYSKPAGGRYFIVTIGDAGVGYEYADGKVQKIIEAKTP